MNLEGKVAIITGASRGLGKAIAKGFSPLIGNYVPGTAPYRERILKWRLKHHTNM